MGKKLTYSAIGLALVLGIGLLFYPSISSWYNAQYQIDAVVGYDNTVQNTSQETMQEELEKAEAYNEALTGSGITDPFVPGSGVILPQNYDSILNINSGIMGTVLIPEIDVSLPIYHGTSEGVLKKGVGHMQMTAFPIGGTGNHAVLTGHTGMPNTTLFTDLDKLQIGSRFYIQFYRETHAYEVDQIIVVEPSETNELRPIPGKDFVTLITCTPYGINSHRLFVRGIRVPYENEEAEAVAGQKNDSGGLHITYDLIIAVCALALVIIVLVTALVLRHKKIKQQTEKLMKHRVHRHE